MQRNDRDQKEKQNQETENRIETGVARNPDPRANENLADKKDAPEPRHETGQEITDGEAG